MIRWRGIPLKRTTEVAVATVRCVSVCAVLALAAGCAAGRISLPEGPGTPFPGYAALFETAVFECATTRQWDGLIRLRGRSGGIRINDRVAAGLAAPGSVRLELRGPFGQVGFILVASPDEATLWLTREGRVLRDVSAADMLEALIGLPFGPDDLRAVLTGCLVPNPQPTAGRSIGEWVVVDLVGGAVAYLQPVDGEYHLTVGVRDGITIEYDRFRRRTPRLVRLRSLSADANDRARPFIDLEAAFTSVNLNLEFPDGAFSAAGLVPADAVSMTLEDLRRMRPMEASPESRSFD